MKRGCSSRSTRSDRRWLAVVSRPRTGVRLPIASDGRACPVTSVRRQLRTRPRQRVSYRLDLCNVWPTTTSADTTMKKAQLEKIKAAKIEGGMRRERGSLPAGTPPAVDRKERRKLDQAAGLVPFAVKLHGDLVKRIHARAQERKASVNEVVAELLEKALGKR